MSDPRYPDVDLSQLKRDGDMPAIDDPSHQLPVYRGEGVRKPKRPKDLPARSPMTEAMKRRMAMREE